MGMLADRGVAIIGYGETKLEWRSALSLAREGVNALIKRTGLECDCIDGFATTLAMSEAGPFLSNLLAEGLGLSVTWC